jgi:hypothetical protein
VLQLDVGHLPTQPVNSMLGFAFRPLKMAFNPFYGDFGKNLDI